MGYICKLVRGSLTLNLNSAPYSLASGFVPPAINEVASIAVGTSANRYGGGRKVDDRTLPRDYSFSVRVMGNSNKQCEAAIDRLDLFLRQGTDDNPNYFIFKPDNNIPVDPLWGQDSASRRCKILKGHCEKSGDMYSEADIRNRVIFADVTMTINGVEGLLQRAGLAMGGIIENKMFSPDGVSRGLMIPEGTINIFDNPVFGNADPDNQYTTGAGAISATNADKDFVYPGATNSIKLTCVTAATATFYQSITTAAVAHTHSAWVKKADGTAASATDVKIYYDAAQTSTYTYLGNGITRVSFSNTPTAAAHNIGVILMTVGATIYLMGCQSEAKAYPTPLCWGDLMGCSWGGTAHADASTSTRTAAWWGVSAAKSLNIAEGTMVVVWMPDKANTELAADVWLFEEAFEFQARFDNDDEKFYFTDGTNTISSSATTYAANTPMVLHFVYEAGSLKIYRAGAEIATGGTYTPHVFGDNLFLGTDESGANHCNGTFLGFHTYDYALSATEIANDYANIWQHVSGGDGYGQQLEPIPWTYSTDGDGVCDAYCDATHQDWIICGGIPGSLPAETILYVINSTADRSLTIVNHQSPVFHSPSDYFLDKSGTADAAALGGQVLTVANVNLTAVLGAAVSIAPAITRDLNQYPVRIWASLNDVGANLKIAPRVELNANSVGHTGDYRPITTSATLKQFITFDVDNMENPEIQYGKHSIYSDTLDYELWLQRSVSGAANVTIDYLRVLFGDFTYIYNDVAANSRGFLVNGNEVYILNHTTLVVTKITTIQGKVFELHPDTLNHVIMLTGDLGSDTDNTKNTVISYIDVIPRWALA